jgi:hypothetical protein
MQFNIRVNNLIDKAYAERADYTSFSQDRYFPARPGQDKFTRVWNIFGEGLAHNHIGVDLMSLSRYHLTL